MSIPLISIVVPVFNMGDRIERCLQSILKQCFTEIEILVIDDGSADPVEGSLSASVKEDPRIRVLTEAHEGVSAARNKGIMAAQGRYLMFIDADDEIEDGYLQRIAHSVAETDADIVVWGIKRRQADGAMVEWVPELSGKYSRREFLRGFPREQYGYHEGLYGFVANKLIKRTVVQAAGLHFNPAFHLMEDYDFFLDGYAHGTSFLCLPETGYIYEQAPVPAKRPSVDYSQLIEVHTKCINLLKREEALSAENEQVILHSIGDLALSMFLEMKPVRYSKVKSCLSLLWDNPYCIPALKTLDTRWHFLKRELLQHNVWGTWIVSALWRCYLQIRTGGKS
ncbi:MAG: glycosyltransferase family 2 protein [Bacteroidales bacterium]|nr:glycosyltransferase family 2 protein [Bacteroidales bacterium]